MKRKDVRTKKQIIKAVSIGLSAAMMMQPVAAMADEVNPENSVEPIKQEAETPVEITSAVDDAQAAEKIADASIAEADKAIDEAKEAYKELEKLEESATEAEKEQIEDVKEVLEAVESMVSNADASENDVVENLNDAEDALIREIADVSAADKAVSEATKIAEDVSANVASANETIEKATEEIKNASTIAAAAEALDEVNKTAEKAEADVTEAEKEFAKKQEAFTAALDDLLVAKKTYTEAVENADANASAAYAELQEAQKEAAKLEQELKEAQAKLDDDAAYSILLQEEARKAQATDNWTEFDKLFYNIIENYFVPEVEGGTNVTVNKFTKFQDDSEKNYCEVTYTKDGETVTKYYNYKLNAEKTGMEMFEKELVYVDYNDNGAVEKTYTKADIESKLADGTAVMAKDEAGNDVIVVLSGEENVSVSENEVDTFASTVTFANETEAKTFANGTVLRVITADVTTTTRENVGAESGNVYNTEAERNAALAEATKDLSNVSSNDTSAVDSYSSSASYIMYFRDVTTKNETWYERGTASAYAAGLDTYAKNEHEYSITNRGEYELSQSGSISAGADRWEGATAGRGHWEDEYVKVWGKKVWVGRYWVVDEWPNPGHYECTVSGTVTVDYAKTTSETQSYNTFTSGLHDTFVFWEEKDIDKLKKAAKEKVEAEGGVFVDVAAVNWNTKTAQIVYVPAQNISASGTYATREEAIAAVEAAAQNAAKANGAYGAQNVKASATENYKYGYTYTGVSSNEATEEGVTIFSSTTAGDDVVARPWSNANYTNKVGITSELEDTAFRNWLASAQAKKNAYDALVVKANAAKAKVDTAAEKVETLKEEIEALKGQDNFDEKIDSLKADLKDASDVLDKAKEELEKVKKAAEEAKDRYNETVARLTPADTEDEGDDTTPVTPVNLPPVLPVAAPPTAPVRPAATPTVVAAVEETPVVEIAAAETPLAAAPVEEEAAAPVVEVKEDEVPLAPTAEEQQQMSWWWILLVLVLGTAGAESFRRYQIKKKAAKVESVEKDAK